jgi:hypothetical protein
MTITVRKPELGWMATHGDGLLPVKVGVRIQRPQVATRSAQLGAAPADGNYLPRCKAFEKRVVGGIGKQHDASALLAWDLGGRAPAESRNRRGGLSDLAIFACDELDHPLDWWVQVGGHVGRSVTTVTDVPAPLVRA